MVPRQTGEIKLIYVDDSTAIRMQIFPQGGKPAGKRGALNDYPQLAAPGSRLGAYWPFVLSQDVGGKLRWSRYWGGAAGHPFWESGTDAIGINGAPGTGLVVLPAASRYLDAGGIVYRRADGKVNNYLADRKGNTTGFAWANGMSSILLAASFAAVHVYSSSFTDVLLFLSPIRRPLQQRNPSKLAPRRFHGGAFGRRRHGPAEPRQHVHPVRGAQGRHQHAVAGRQRRVAGAAHVPGGL